MYSVFVCYYIGIKTTGRTKLKKYILSETEISDYSLALLTSKTEAEAARKLGLSKQLLSKRMRSNGYRTNKQLSMVKING